MTKAEIFIQTLSEVSGRPKDEIAEMLKAMRKARPGGKWDDEVPPAEAEKLVNDLRAEVPGILAWLVRGGIEAQQEIDAARKNGKVH